MKPGEFVVVAREREIAAPRLFLSHPSRDGRSDKRDVTPQTRGWRTGDGSAFGRGKGRRIERGEVLWRDAGRANWHAVLKSSVAWRRRGAYVAPAKMMNCARIKLGREK